jgi:hypothetical protein
MFKKTIVLVAAFISLFLNIGITEPRGEVITSTLDANVISMPEIENPYVVIPSAIKNMYNPILFPDIYLIAQPNSFFTNRADYNSTIELRRARNPIQLRCTDRFGITPPMSQLFFTGKV